ncbi:5f41604d-0a07-48db-8dc7-c9fb228dec02 [Sclerotinia trifoliorum]|uniref:5f41604d-0a07-48db-8dc7-c9fb228dec02 n=1 Tax=Sclerotinia trifoliorum TaxID=28548 RepID=A0A8H2ZMV6_9HELO|nr:5f41604d-0a07-48db-8dc7-c9fb228dec02 [Sclerotinia trifoliorum]
MSCSNIFDCLPSPSKVLRKSSGKAKLANSSNMDEDNLAYGTMDTDRPEAVAGSNERIERPKNDRRKTTYTFPIKIMPSPKSSITSGTNLTPEFTEFDTQAYYNESLDYNYISSRFAFSLGLKPDADREAKPRSKSVSKPRVPFKPKTLARSQTAPIAEIKPLQRSRTEPLSRRIFSPLSRESTIEEDAPPPTSTTSSPLPPRVPPRRTSTTATLVPSNSQAPPIFSFLEPTPEAISRSNLTSPLFPDSDLNPFSPRPGATFSAMVVDTPPRMPQRPKPLHSHTEGQPSLFEALNSHPVTPMPNVPTILTEEPDGISEEPEGTAEEAERDLEGMGTGTGIGMGFGIGEEIRGRENQDPDSMTGDLTLHWKSSPLSRYTQRTVFWIVPHAKFDIVFGHDETDFNIPIQNPPKWGLGTWGIGGGERGRRGERNQFREGIRRGVLKKVEEQSTFSLLYSATNLMDAWLRPPYSANMRSHSAHSDSKTPLLGNSNENENGRYGDHHESIHHTALTFPELEYQLRNELNCTDERRRKHEGKRAVNIWDVRAGKAVLAEQAKGASGEIRKLVGAVVKDVRERDGGRDNGKKVRQSPNPAGIGRAPPLEEEAETGAGTETEITHDKIAHVETTPNSAATVIAPSNSDVAIPVQPKSEIEAEVPISAPPPTDATQEVSQVHSEPLPTPLPNPQTFELSPTTANESPSSSLRVEFTDAQMQAQIQAQMDREMEMEMEREMERETERELQEQIDAEMQAQAQAQTEAEAKVGSEVAPPALPPRPKRSETHLNGHTEQEQETETEPEPKNLIIHDSISKIRSAHAHHDDDSADEEENEAMSEIMISKIPIQQLHLADGTDDASLEQMSVVHFSLPDASFGTLEERFEKLWEWDDETVHVERKVWRGRFRGVLGELLRVRVKV